MTQHEPSFARQSVFRAGSIQFDEARMELLVDGQRRALETKPLALLQALLARGGAVTSKRALIEAAWGNADHISEASLMTAMSKLRAALGEKGRDLIGAVSGVGYRITAAVEVVAVNDAFAFAFCPGDPVPGRPQWQLDRILGSGVLRDVWLARHKKTGETRVFKFADSDARLKTLQREASLSRVLHATLGARDDLVRIAEWNFDKRPFFIESPYGGLDLSGWAATKGGLAALPLDLRLALLAQIARTAAAAHGAGVLHGDIKPANILVSDGQDGLPLARLVDFGAGRLSDPAQLAALSITIESFGPETGQRGTGTFRYMAPEVLAGRPVTTAADIFALGILLYQLVAGDLSRSLSVGWEADISDYLLRLDIQDAAAGDPARRTGSASALAQNLETLPARREARDRRIAEAAHANRLARALEREQLRRPWIAAAVLSLAAGLTLSALFGLRALHDRDEARRRAEIALAVNGFLTEDLLGRGNPANSGKADETLMEAAQAAESSIDRRLSFEPMVAGAIYLSLAKAFDSRSAYDAAHTAYDHAIAAFRKAGSAGRSEMVIAQLHKATTQVLSGQPGSLADAKATIAAAAPQVASLGGRRAEAQVWLDASLATLEMLGGDVRAAKAGYTKAADAAETIPAVFDEGDRLAFRQQQAFTLLRLGEWGTAKTMFETLLRRRFALSGPRHPKTLEVELNLAQVGIAQGKSASVLLDLQRIGPDFTVVFGANHSRTLAFLATRAQALSQLERYQEAVTDQMAIYSLAVAKQGENSFLALGTLTDAAQSLCRAGDIQKGLALAVTAHDGALSAYGAKAGITQAASGNLAFCEITVGDFAVAVSQLQAIDRQKVAQLTIDPAYGAELDLMMAAAAFGTGDRQHGQVLLERARPYFERPDADTYMRRWTAKLNRDSKVE